MANPGYVRSTDGNDADNGSTWALANATAAGAITDASAGDTIYFSQAHSESTASAVSLTFPGTNASPNNLIGASDAAEPPTTVSTAPIIATSGASSNLTISGCFYAYGLNFRSGVGATNVAEILIGQADQDHQMYDTCTFDIQTTSTGADYRLGNTSVNTESRLIFRNCTFTFGSTGQGFELYSARLLIEGGSIAGSAITELFQQGSGTAHAEITGMDLSACASAVNLITSGATAQGIIRFKNCKLPTSWSGGLFAGAPNFPGLRAEMLNCSASDTNYSLWVEEYTGYIKHETTLVKTSGASDGTTSLSWRMTTNANAEYPSVSLRSPQIQIWNETVGSSVTVTVDFLHDSVTNLQDDEIWLDVEYLGTSGVPLSVFTSDAAANFLATPADQTTSSATWTTTGMTNPNEQKLSVTFTPQEKGLIVGHIHVAKASYTVYVDPLLQVS